MTARRERLLLALAIALVSAGALAYQVLLMRLLAIVHWYPFAALIVSLALLGHGVSGTVLALAAERARRQFAPLVIACATAFGVAAVAGFALAQRVPFNGLELVWDARQVLALAAIDLVLALPFFCAALVFGLAFVARGERIPALYGADLAGAGLGALIALATIAALPLADALVAIAALGPLAAVSAALAFRWRATALALALVATLMALFVPRDTLVPQPNPYKGLARALTVTGARVVGERSGPLGWLVVVDNPVVPWRHVPGFSLAAGAEPPPQRAVFVDGDAMSVVTAPRGAEATLAATTAALPYALLQAPRVAVLGAGSGADVLQALVLGAREVVAVERDPNRIAIVREDEAALAGRLYDDPRVALVVADARAYLRRPVLHDAIVLPLADSSVGAAGGTQAAADQFLYTVEALAAAYARLAPGGYLVATRWETQPPRASLKLFATAVAALRAHGVAEPGAQLALIRDWQTSTLVVRRGALGARERDAIRRFTARWSFDAAYLPGGNADEANHHHVVADDVLYRGTRALVSAQAAEFLAAYKFDLAPATDARPFFHDFFRWRALPELWRLREHGGAALLDSGYLVVVAGLVQAVPLALVLIVLPLAALRRAHAPARTETWLYFTALGFGFLFVEIALMSRAALFVGDALIANATVLAALLVSAGLGSAAAARLVRRGTSPAQVALVCAALIALNALASPCAGSFSGASEPASRAALAALAIAPLGVVLGMPFPLALARLAATAPAQVPWAWGINGCASVVAALTAVIVALEAGYDAVLWTGAALYLIAAWAAQR